MGEKLWDLFLNRKSLAIFVCLGLCLLILLADHITDPYIQFPALFIIPVTFASAYLGVAWGVELAVILPIVRFCLEFRMIPGTVTQELVNTAIRMAVFLGFAVLVAKTIKQTRALAEEVQTLEGLLPICSYCKRIRTENNSWEQLESYISEHSEARFSHGLCEDCLREHYPQMAEKLKNSGEGKKPE
jgi:hypothetical protein